MTDAFPVVEAFFGPRHDPAATSPSTPAHAYPLRMPYAAAVILCCLGSHGHPHPAAV